MQISKIAESSIISAFIGIYLLLFSIGTQHLLNTSYILGFPGSSASRESACIARDPKSIPRSEISPRKGIGYPLQYPWASLEAQKMGKIPWRRAWQPTPVFLPGESPWTEEPGGLQTMGSQRVRHD